MFFSECAACGTEGSGIESTCRYCYCSGPWNPESSIWALKHVEELHRRCSTQWHFRGKKDNHSWDIVLFGLTDFLCIRHIMEQSARPPKATFTASPGCRTRWPRPITLMVTEILRGDGAATPWPLGLPEGSERATRKLLNPVLSSPTLFTSSPGP